MRAVMSVLVVAGALLSIACGPSAAATSGTTPPKQEVVMVATTVVPQVVAVEVTPPPATQKVGATKVAATEAAIAAVLAEVETYIDEKGRPFKKSNTDGPYELFFTASAKQMEYKGQKVLWYHLETTLRYDQIKGSLMWDELEEVNNIFFAETHKRINDIPFDAMYMTLSLSDRPWVNYNMTPRAIVVEERMLFTLAAVKGTTEKQGPPPWVLDAK